MFEENYHGRCGAIIPAAGLGERLGYNIPKALVKIAGVPMIHLSVEALISSGIIYEIIVVAPPDWVDKFRSILAGITLSLRVVAGGTTRTESVRLGLDAISENIEFIAIHDAARPLVMPEEVREVVVTASKSGAATLAIPVKDTIKKASDKIILETLDRNDLWAIQTPQVFRRDIILEAYSSLGRGVSFTDDCAAIEALGGRVELVRGTSTNFKITYPEDIALAEAILGSRG